MTDAQAGTHLGQLFDRGLDHGDLGVNAAHDIEIVAASRAGLANGD
jgi:hypothetical protein